VLSVIVKLPVRGPVAFGLKETDIVQIEAEAEEPIAALEEPVAEPAAEPPSEFSTATPASETEAPELQPEEEASKFASALPAAASVAPPAPPPTPAKTEAELKTAARIVAAVKAREESADPSPFSILVDQVYDGPLDLLLDLIRKQDIDIYDIPIATITAQFAEGGPQVSVTDLFPLMMMGFGLATPISKVAVPVTTHFPARPGKLPDTV